MAQANSVSYVGDDGRGPFLRYRTRNRIATTRGTATPTGKYTEEYVPSSLFVAAKSLWAVDSSPCADAKFAFAVDRLVLEEESCDVRLVTWAVSLARLA